MNFDDLDDKERLKRGIRVRMSYSGIGTYPELAALAGIDPATARLAHVDGTIKTLRRIATALECEVAGLYLKEETP